MESKIIIREARKGDLEQMVGLWAQLMDFHKGMDIFFRVAEGAETIWCDYIKDNIAKEGSLVLVAEADNRIVGHCLAMIEEYPPVLTIKRYGWIGEMVVDKTCRRKGIGEKLFGGVRKWFAEKDIKRIEVRMSVFNELSTSFWRKMGFEPFLERLCMNLD